MTAPDHAAALAALDRLESCLRGLAYGRPRRTLASRHRRTLEQIRDSIYEHRAEARNDRRSDA